jgi:MFS-type transporter involved in bile tolerance (Atg22 family)
MSTRRWLNKEVFGWAMFDFANQAFTLVILTTMFHLYFVNHIVPEGGSQGRQLWAVSGIIALLIVIAVSPLIGALADFSGAKKKLLFVTYVASVVLTAALGLLLPGQVAAGMTLFIVGYIFYAIGENFMGSFLPELASHSDMGKVSAFGWTMGYVGGLSCLAGAAVITFAFPVNASVFLGGNGGGMAPRVEMKVPDDRGDAARKGPLVEGTWDALQDARNRAQDAGSARAMIVHGDLNGDGFVDQVTLDLERDVVAIDIGDGKGGFRAVHEYPAGPGTRAIQLADVDGDGRIDIVVARQSTSATGFRFVCLWAGLFFLGSALPTFLLVRERKQREEMPPGQTFATIGFHRMATTFRDMKHYGQLFRFLAIMTFYLGGMQIVIWFAGSIGKKIFGLSDEQLALYILVLTVTAIIGAFLTGRFQDQVGTRRTIIGAMVLWLAVMAAVPFARPTNPAMFWILGSGVGLGMGILGTASRAMVGLFSPPHKAAEFFGFYGLGTKVAAVLALAASIVAEKVFPNNYNLVVASSGVFFIGGLVLMFTVDEEAGRKAATEAALEHVRKHHDYRGEIAAEPDAGGD